MVAWWITGSTTARAAGWIGKDLAPLTERLVCGDERNEQFVAALMKLEQHAGLGLILADVGEVVEDQEVEAVEPVDGGLEGEFAAGDLQLLDRGWPVVRGE